MPKYVVHHHMARRSVVAPKKGVLALLCPRPKPSVVALRALQFYLQLGKLDVTTKRFHRPGALRMDRALQEQEAFKSKEYMAASKDLLLNQ